MGVRPEKQIDGFLRSFAVSEGLFRATSLTANVVMTSMVAQVGGFGADGVLASAAVHLSVAAIAMMICASGVQRWAESHVPLQVEKSATATWFSLVQTGALALFAVTAGLIYVAGGVSVGGELYSIATVAAGITIALITSAKESSEIQRVARFLAPEVDKAIKSVDDLVADFLEVGSPHSPQRFASTEAEGVIRAGLEEVTGMYPDSKVQVSFNVQHRKPITCDPSKLARVIANVVANAYEAMNHAGDLSFATKDIEEFVEIRIVNTGSFVPPEEIPRLFDSFFTRGKKDGTGLGLAIVKKIVVAHGGTVRCESVQTAEFPDGRVEFIFCIPSVA